MLPLHVLRNEYCLRCRVKSPRSTGTKILENVLSKLNLHPSLIVDYGCSTWRNSQYLRSKYSSMSVKIDITQASKPDIIAYPTKLPLRSKCCDVFLLTHILMFLRSSIEMSESISEAKRVSRIIVIECYHVKNPSALKYSKEQLEEMFLRLNLKVLSKRTRRDMENYVLSFSNEES